MIQQPKFWRKKAGAALLLLPLSLIWWTGTQIRGIWARRFSQPARSSSNRPAIICVGNLTIGGTGKTPVARLVVEMLQQSGWTPAILSRGYGGNLQGPVFVDKDKHTAREVGDEPLLLAGSAPVCVSRDRAAGARYIAENSPADMPVDVIVMDDGLQNPYLDKDISIGVFDGQTGIGNGFLLPAGPLRQPFSSGIQKLEFAILNGPDETGLSRRLPAHLPALQAALHPELSKESLPSGPFYAFAGIGRPERFFTSLHDAGLRLSETKAFSDHHLYSETELAALAEAAARSHSTLITTEKDWVRLPPEWRGHIVKYPVKLILSEADHNYLSETLNHQLRHVISS